MSTITVHDVAAKAGVTPSRIWQVIHDMKMKPKIVKISKGDGRKHRTAMFTAGQARGITARLGSRKRSATSETPDWKLSLAKLVASLPDDLMGLSIERNGPHAPKIIVRRRTVTEERLAL